MNILVGADKENIVNAVRHFEKVTPEKIDNPYDFGGASKKIVDACLELF